jgi:hypothetical protein
VKKAGGSAGKGAEASSGKDKSLTHGVDALFKMPLAEFTAARNALATRLKKAGQPGDAEAIKALQKPSVAAWVVNQLYWHHREEFDRLIETGERFRRAQAAQLSGQSSDVREPLNGRREVLASLARVAADVLQSGSYSATPDMMRRVTSTLEALSTYGSLPDAPRAGRLTDDVEPPGFETLAALVPRIGQARREADEGPTRVLPFRADQEAKAAKRKDSAEEEKRRQEERKAQVTAAKAAVRDAERTLHDARKSAEQAEANLKKAALQAKEAERERADLEKRMAKVAAEADEAREQARRVAEEAEDAAQSVEDAERALEQARRQLQQLEPA